MVFHTMPQELTGRIEIFIVFFLNSYILQHQLGADVWGMCEDATMHAI